MDDKKLSKNNILQIVQIFDTDGTFIKDEFIEAGNEAKFEYTLTSIKCKYPQNVMDRNKRKCDAMKTVIGVKVV